MRREEKEKQLQEIHDRMSQPDFWQNRLGAQKISQESADLERWLAFVDVVGGRGDKGKFLAGVLNQRLNLIEF